jgi:hypothetical protein
MKKQLFLWSLTALLLVSCQNEKPKGANGVTYQSAVEYNDYIVGRQTTLMKNIMNFVQVAQNDLDSAELLLDKYVKETSIMVKDIKGMPPFKGDSTLRDAAVGIFGFYKKIFDKDYRDIIHLRKEQDGTSQDIEDRINQIVKNVEEEEKGFDNRFQSAQKAFAKSNKMKLIENEMQKEFDDKLKTEE